MILKGCFSCVLAQPAITHVNPSCIHYLKVTFVELKKKKLQFFSTILKKQRGITFIVFTPATFSMNNHKVCVCVCSLPLPDGVGEHRGDAGHVFRDGGHLPVPSHGHGGCPGVRQLAQLQRD